MYVAFNHLSIAEGVKLIAPKYEIIRFSYYICGKYLSAGFKFFCSEISENWNLSSSFVLYIKLNLGALFCSTVIRIEPIELGSLRSRPGDTQIIGANSESDRDHGNHRELFYKKMRKT